MKKIFLMALSVLFFGTVANAKGNGAEGDAKTPNGVEAVDLGLSVKWANMNVGAQKDSGFGSYFAWGDWSKGNTQFLVKYSVADRKTQLVPSDDAARATWGGDWRMPTVDEYEELLDPDKCKWEWTTKDGVNGYKITGKKTGKSIFMPITGFRFYEGVQFRAIKGIYWTSTVYGGNPVKSWCLEFDFQKADLTPGNLSANRFSGRCIRAVR